MRDSVVAAASRPREPSDADIQAARSELEDLSNEAFDLLYRPEAAPLHCAMGRIYGQRLGDARSAAICFQNAFQIDPTHRPTLEAARQLFVSAGRLDRALALHEREEALLTSPAERAESLRAQTELLAQQGKLAEAARRARQATELAPDHPALLAAAVDAATDAAERARLLVRFADAVQDGVYQAYLLATALAQIEELRASRSTGEVEALYEETLGKLLVAEPKSGIGNLAVLQRSLASSDWGSVLQLWRDRTARTGTSADGATVAHILAWRLGRPAEALAELQAAPDAAHDAEALALCTSLAEEHGTADLLAALRARAAASPDASERADLKALASSMVADPLEQERLLSEALADSPGDAAAIAQHARLVARRDAVAAAERFVAVGDALAQHVPLEAAARYAEAAAWLERAGQREHAAATATKALALAPGSGASHAALRLLQRTAPFIQAQGSVGAILEQAAVQFQPASAAQLLARAAALLSDAAPQTPDAPQPRIHALQLARRAAELGAAGSVPAHLDEWATLALRCGDLAALSVALEMRAASCQGLDAAELLVEAAESSRAVGDDARALDLLRKARAVHPAAESARRALLVIPYLSDLERADLLGEEARDAEGARSAAVHAERAAVLEVLGRLDESAQCCSEAVAQGGADLAVLRRLARVQLRRRDWKAAVDALTQVAAVASDGAARAEVLCRAAEIAEWNADDASRALELYAAAADAHAGATKPLAHLARLHTWMGHLPHAAVAYEQLAERSTMAAEQSEALRWAAILRSRADRGAAVSLWRKVLAGAAGDSDAVASLLQLAIGDPSPGARTERAELRAKLATRCADPRVAALLRVEAAREHMAAGQIEDGIAEYRRALALNPADRIALDGVEQALRTAGRPELLAEHLAFRSAYADSASRAALALEQGELLEQAGHLDAAAVAYRQALEGDPGSRLAKRGARRVADRIADRHARAKDGAGPPDHALEPGRLVEAALLAQHLDAEQFLREVPANDDLPVPGIAAQDAQRAPEQAISEPLLHEMFTRAQAEGRSDAALAVASVLTALGIASADERAVYEQFAAQLPPAELPRVTEDDRLLAADDRGASRDLLAAGAAELNRALHVNLSGRGDRIRGDNPVRRICAAIARALGIEEPALYVAKREPGIVVPTATDPAGLLVGLEVPKRYQARQQRFLYARALAHIRRGTHPLATMAPDRLRQVVAELVRIAAPPGTDTSQLPARDAPLAHALEAAIRPGVRGRLAPLAARAAAEAANAADALRLAMRETAERTALLLCGDPAAGLAIALAEAPGGLERPEIARLVRFAVSDAYLALRAG